MAKYNLEKYKEAIVDFNKAIEINPDNTYAREGLELAKSKLNEANPNNN